MNTLYSSQVRGPHNTTLSTACSYIYYTATSLGPIALGHNFFVRFVDYLMLAETCSHAVSTGSSKKMDGIWNRYNLKSTGRIYTFGVLKCSEKFKVLDLP